MPSSVLQVLPLMRVGQGSSWPFAHFTMHLPVSRLQLSRPAAVHSASDLHWTSRRTQPVQSRRTRAPAIWICEVQPRCDERRAAKSKSS